MGTTLNKLEYLDETKGQIKTALNQFDSGITDNDTFRSYVDKINDIYDNWEKTEYAEGTNITLNNTKKAKLNFDEDNEGNKIIGKGNCEQGSTTGANIFDLKKFITDRGGSYTENSDGSITFSTQAVFYSTPLVLFDTPTTVSCEASITNVSSSNFRIVFLNGSTVVEQVRTSETKKENMLVTSIRFDWSTGGNVTLKNVMVNTGTTVKSFEPYTGGIPSPNPDYEQPITVVTGEKEVVIKDENNNVITTKTIDFGTLEFAGIGDYKDEILYDINEDKLYKYGVIGKVRLIGENITSFSATQLSGSYQATFNITTKASVDEQLVMSNYFSKAILTDRNTKTNIIYTFSDGYLRLATNVANSTLAITAWLSNNNVLAYYVLATATTTEITDTTLKSQLKEIYNLMSVNGTTIIETDGMILKVRALRKGSE